MAKLSVKDHRQRLSHMDGIRLPHLQEWIVLANLMCPRRGLFLTMGLTAAQAKDRYEKIINSTGMEALRIASMGTQQMMASPSLSWLEYEFEDPGLNKWPKARRWVEECVDILYRLKRGSNFYQSYKLATRDFWGFANSPIMVWPHPTKGAAYEVVPPGQYCLGVDQFGEVDTMYRSYPMTARNMIEKFGKGDVSERVRKAAEKNPFDVFQVIMVIEPREADKVVADSPMVHEMPYRISYMEAEGGADAGFLKESGCPEWPGGVALGERIGTDAYGTGPAHDVRFDVAMLQGIDKELLLAIQQSVRPSMVLPPELKGKTRSVPGGFTWARVEDSQAIRALYSIQFQLGPANDKLKDTETKVKRGMFNDVFLLFRDHQIGQITATQVVEMAGEKLIFLGSAVDPLRDQNEQIGTREFGICMRAGIMPPPPPEIVGQNMNLNFKGPLAQAQRAAGLKPNKALKAEVQEVSQTHPEAAKLFNAEEYLRRFQELNGASVDVLYSPEKLKAQAEAAAQAQQAAQQTQALQGLLGTAKQLSDIPLDNKSALTEMLGADVAGRA